MKNHSEKAMDLFKQGYNCSQSVLLAFSDKTGLKDESLSAVSSFRPVLSLNASKTD